MLTGHLSIAELFHYRCEWCCRLLRFRRLVVRLFRLRLCSYPIWSDARQYSLKKRHCVVPEVVLDRRVVTSAATATWRNVDVVYVQLLTIMHHNLIAPDEDRLTVERAA